MRPATQKELEEKIEEEKLELTDPDSARSLQYNRGNANYNIYKYEEYAFKKLTEIFGDYFDLETTMVCGSRKITVDGIFYIKNVFMITEVIHVANIGSVLKRIDRTISMMQIIDKEWAQATVEMKFLITLVTPLKHGSYAKIKEIVEASFKQHNLYPKLIIYNTQDLEDEFQNAEIVLTPVRGNKSGMLGLYKKGDIN